jgi:hypothetical protein
MNCNIIGIDCATDDKKVGLAYGTFENDRLEIHETIAGGVAASPRDVVSEWIHNRPGRTLLAIDAPLGWPQPLFRSLAAHQAGRAIDVAANELFRRATDLHIYSTLRKTPLDVGADRIARTAHAALRLLGDLRGLCNLAIPLAWDPEFTEMVSAIEVYPAATLLTHLIRSNGYKKSEQHGERGEILERLAALAALPTDVSPMMKSADVLDAAVCVLAGADFLAGHAVAPSNQELAASEGWIWARRLTD